MPPDRTYDAICRSNAGLLGSPFSLLRLFMARNPISLAVHPVGQLGNRLLALFFAHHLSRLMPNAIVTGCEIEEFPVRFGQGPNPLYDGDREITLTGHDVDVPALLREVEQAGIERINLRGVFARVEYFGDRRDELRELIDFGAPSNFFDDDQLAIHVRSGPHLTPMHIHEDFTPAPLSFHEQIIAETGLKPVFIGQFDDHFYPRAIQARFPDAEFVSGGSPAEDFGRLMSARNIVASVSSYCWLASWFSRATRIHLPLLGFLNPIHRADCDLLPTADARYAFYEFPVIRWDASLEQQDLLTRQHVPMKHLAPAAVDALKVRAREGMRDPPLEVGSAKRA
ncbi:MAG: hypothetical protein JNJ73_11680 [Hyphomonadaceae bacterium]|nr:hypothetical protein [Hyphomonadaceae bacterium]